MAKQRSIFTLRGTIDGVTFYKTAKDGHLAKAKSSIDKKRIQTDPRFARTRENGAEFGHAGKACKTMRNALRDVLMQGKDSRVTSRLTTQLLAVAKTDNVNVRGSRNVTKGALGLLKNFEFNFHAKLGSTFFAPFTPTMNRVSGAMKIDIPAFTPVDSISAPPGATHFLFAAACTEVDFLKELSATAQADSALLPYDSNKTAVISLDMNMTPNSVLPQFLLLGIQFYQMVNGQAYALKNGSFNPLSIIEVDAP